MKAWDETPLGEHKARRQCLTDDSESVKTKVSRSPSSPSPNVNCTKPLPPLPTVSDADEGESHPPNVPTAASIPKLGGTTTLPTSSIAKTAGRLVLFWLWKRKQKDGKLPNQPEMVDQGTQVSLSNDLQFQETSESDRPHIKSMPTSASTTDLFDKQESPYRDSQSAQITPIENGTDTRRCDYFGFDIEPVANHRERNSSSSQSASPTSTVRRVRRSNSSLRHVSFALADNSSIAGSSLNSIGTYESRYSSRVPTRLSVVPITASDPALLVGIPHTGRPVNGVADNTNPSTRLTEAGKFAFSDAKDNNPKPTFQKFVAYHDVPKARPSRGGRAHRRTSSSSVSPLRQELTLSQAVDQASGLTIGKNGMGAPQTSTASTSQQQTPNWFNVPLQIPFHDLDGESNVPVHFPGSPLCPSSTKYRWGGPRICPMHGPHLYRDLDSPRTETSPWLNRRVKQPPLVTVLTPQTTSNHNAMDSNDFEAFNLRAPEHDLDSPMCPANAIKGRRELCVYHGRGRAVTNVDEMPKRIWTRWARPAS